MTSDPGVRIRKPVSIWKRPVEVNFGALTKALGKGAIAGAFGSWENLAGSGVDTLDALGLTANNTEAIAWMLVQRSLLQAMSDLVKNYQKLLSQEPDFNLLCRQLDLALESEELSLDSSFFERPKDLSIVATVQAPYERWLQTCGLSAVEAESIVNRLPRYFVFALNEQWRSRPQDYTTLKAKIDTPFTKATDRELAWMRYSAWLQRSIDEPMFAEAFSLRQIYVPLRAYYERKVKDSENKEPQFSLTGQEQKVERVVIDLMPSLMSWIEKADKDDAIRVICGGPGYGKSSIAKMLAAQLSESSQDIGQQEIAVLLVPLHQFDPSGDLINAMNDFIQVDLDGILPPNPLKRDNAERRLLLIFDGLDELTMQGKVAAQAAQDFVREVQRKILAFNRNEARVLVLISGRDLAVQANRSEFRQEEQILHVLPYFLTEEDREKYQYVDEQNLLEQDQRQEWWQKYGKLKGYEYGGLPSELARSNLVEITSQPLLNYLVALSYDRKTLDFSATSNLNAIYNDLLDGVYQRDWGTYPYPALGNIEKKDFIRILEEIAVACWHGNGRTTTVNRIEERCATSRNLKRLLEVFKGGAKEGVTRLLTAFYFRQSGIHGSEATFEFTHKNFGEYLTARRLVYELTLIRDELNRHRDNPDIGWDEKKCLKRWAILCGPSTMDEYLLSFLQDEVRLHSENEVRQWQQTLCTLIKFMLRHGMPMEELVPRPKYLEETRQARNTEEALLAALHACALVTEELSVIDWPTPTAFGIWLTRLQGQQTGDEQFVTLDCLNYLDLKGSILSFQNLLGADLVGANLSEAELMGARLLGANLAGANLARANLFRANLVGAELSEAELSEANLVGAELSEAELSEANLAGARLYGANLAGAELTAVDLSGANLSEADFYGANLIGANLIGADLAGADLAGADLAGADLAGANLKNIHWNEYTSWKDIEGIESAIDVPEQLKQKLGL